MGPVLTPDSVGTELISRTPIWSPSIRLGKIFHREDGFSDIVCNMSIKKKKVEIRPAITCQMPIYHHKDERVWSWFTSVAQ